MKIMLQVVFAMWLINPYRFKFNFAYRDCENIYVADGAIVQGILLGIMSINIHSFLLLCRAVSYMRFIAYYLLEFIRYW